MIVPGFTCSWTHRILSGNGAEGGVENVCALTGRAGYSGPLFFDHEQVLLKPLLDQSLVALLRTVLGLLAG